MENILVADETPSAGRKLAVLASIVIRNDALRRDIETALGEVVRNFNSGRHRQIRVLRCEGISQATFQDYTVLLGQVFNYMKFLAAQKDIRILVGLAHPKHLDFDKALLEELLPTEDAFPKVHRLEQMMTSTFFEHLISLLGTFPMAREDCIGSICCDRRFDFVDRAASLGEVFAGLFRPRPSTGTLVSRLMQALHNRTAQTPHEGLREVQFMDIEQSRIVQVCRMLSDLLVSSLQERYDEKGGKAGHLKQLLIENHFDLDRMPLAPLKLEWNHAAKEVEPRGVAAVSIELG